jgi:hypothetical protein
MMREEAGRNYWELCNFYSSPSVIRMIKSNRLIWAGHVAHGEMINASRILA